jgi:predicted nucleic acid-binding protein
VKPRAYRVYLDACCFIDYFTGGATGGVVRQILDLGERGEYEIIASTLLIAEVAKPEPASTISQFFTRSVFTWVQVDRRIATDAADLVRTQSISGADAVHLSTALRMNCSHLFTTDGKLGKVVHQHIEVCAPFVFEPRLL